MNKLKKLKKLIFWKKRIEFTDEEKRLITEMLEKYKDKLWNGLSDTIGFCHEISTLPVETAVKFRDAYFNQEWLEKHGVKLEQYYGYWWKPDDVLKRISIANLLIEKINE